MKNRVLSCVRVGVLLALLLSLALGGLPATAARAYTGALSASAPELVGALIFVENAGQFADSARFQVRGRDLTVWLAEDAIWLSLVGQTAGTSDAVPADAANVRLSFPGANPHPVLEPFDRLETHVSFFTGSDPEKWRADVPAWGGVRYLDLYPGIDLELTGEKGQIVPRLVARPGADLGAVRLRIEGAEAVTMEGDALLLTTAAGQATWPLLRAESFTGEPSALPAGPQTFDVTAPFAISYLLAATSYGPPSIVHGPPPEDNPADLLYGTFLGGDILDSGAGIAVDTSGAAYVTGYTYSTDFPTTPGAFDTSQNGSSDAFVVKLNAAGSALEYGTFLGGSSGDNGTDIVVDGNGAAYVSGYTESSNMPTTPGAFDTSYNGTGDAFVAKLNADGSGLEYATFLGGSGEDSGAAIGVDESGTAIVTGNTQSSDWPTTPGAFDTSYNGGACDAFVTRLSTDGSGLIYSTFLGGTGSEEYWSSGLAVDGDGAAYVTGDTNSSDFPTTPGAFDTSYGGGSWDAFVAKVNAAGSALDYSTFLGAEAIDWAYGIVVDASGAAHVTGHTLSYSFPTTPGAFQPSLAGEADAFVIKLNPAGSALDYGTFLGGSLDDGGNGIALDASGAAILTGITYSSNFPTSPWAFDRTRGGSQDGFVAKLNAAGSHLEYSSYLGGGFHDYCSAIAVDGSGAAYLTGRTQSSDWPATPGAFDTSLGGDFDGFAAKLAMAGPTCWVHLFRMKMNWAYAARPGYVKLVDLGIVHDQEHAKIAGATVSGRWTLPDGSRVMAQGVTDNLGRFKLGYKGVWMAPGTYRFDVWDIQYSECGYDAGANEAPGYLEVTIPQPPQ